MKQGAAPSPAHTCHPASELITVHRPKVFLPTSGTFFKRHHLFASSTQRVCSVGLTATCTSLCSLLRSTIWWHFSTYMLLVIVITATEWPRGAVLYNQQGVVPAVMPAT